MAWLRVAGFNSRPRYDACLLFKMDRMHEPSLVVLPPGSIHVRSLLEELEDGLLRRV